VFGFGGGGGGGVVGFVAVRGSLHLETNGTNKRWFPMWANRECQTEPMQNLKLA
jgi:hypothetical protein